MNSFTLEPDLEYIKIHGLQRSGTNYIAYILNQFPKTKCLINAGGWKHGHYCAPWVLGKEVHVLTITKNPYAWLISLYNYWKHSAIGEDLSDVSFDVFVRNRTVFERQLGIPSLMLAANPVQHWNAMNYHWLSIRMNQKKILTVPYEALLLDWTGVMEVIRQEFSLEHFDKTVECSKTIEPSEENPKFGEEDWSKKMYYLHKEYIKKFDAETLDYVNLQLDAEVMNTLGYQYEVGR